MPHIALITTSYPDGSAGSEAAGSFVEDFALELSRLARVTVIAASTNESTSNENGLTIRRFAVPRIPLSLLNPLHPADWLSILRSLRAGQTALSHLAQTDRPDHILALWALPSGHWADRVAHQHSIPFSVWALGSDIWNLARIPLVKAKLRSVLRRADRRYADGIGLAADVEALSGRDCRFLPSTRRLPTKELGSVADRAPYKLAFLGRWHENKGIDLLLDALAKLRNSDWAAISEIRINGGGPLRKSVAEAARDLSDSGRPVTVGGYLDKSEAAALIAWADYLLLPSRIESIPVVFSDAVQLGTPIIATPVGDLPRLHEEYQFGVLADDTSAASFSGAIRAGLGVSANAFRQGLDSAKGQFDLTRIARGFIDENTGTPHD